MRRNSAPQPNEVRIIFLRSIVEHLWVIAFLILGTIKYDFLIIKAGFLRLCHTYFLFLRFANSLPLIFFTFSP